MSWICFYFVSISGADLIIIFYDHEVQVMPTWDNFNFNVLEPCRG